MAVRIVTTRAPGLIPSLIHEIGQAEHPVILIPESFTLACETEIVQSTPAGGIFDLKIFSPSSLIREIRELTGRGSSRPVSGDGQNMIISQVLHRCREELQYYRDSVAQPTLASKIAGQIDAFTRARLSPEFLREYKPVSRRTRAKLADVALIWDGYRRVLDGGFEDTVGQWMSAVRRIRSSGIIRGCQLLIYGFDYITHDILHLIEEAFGGEGAAAEVVIGLVCDSEGPDKDIFRGASDSVLALEEYLQRKNIPFVWQTAVSGGPRDPGIAYVEKALYARGVFPEGKVLHGKTETTVLRESPAKAEEEARELLGKTPMPDFSHVRLYYARNSYLECQHACQTLTEWHQAGVPWEEMAVAVCEQGTLPSLLPLTLSASGIPFNAKQDQPILMSAYAQYILSLLRILRLGFCQEDVLRLMKTGFTALQPEEVMDMENYARKNGIHRSRWLKPFRIPDRESEKAGVQHLEELRALVIGPVAELKKNLSRKGCTGRQAAEKLFAFITEAGVYDRLLRQEQRLAEQEDDLGIDRNRQVWTAVNDLLDTLATFIGEEALPLHDLCVMLESSLSSRMIKSLPQLSSAVMVAPPQMFFSSGISHMIVMGLQENEIAPGAGILSERERSQLEQFIEASNQQYYQERKEGPEAGPAERPYSKIGQSLLDLAARQKQDVYQAVSLARDELVLSCSGARPSGGVMVPSAAFNRLSELVRKEKPENCTGGLLDPDLRPFSPAFALESLAVRLRDSSEAQESFLTGTSETDLLWKDALKALWASEEWRSRMEGVFSGLHASVSSSGITPEQARLLYTTHGMTISRVETFNSCPYRHFLQYGLNLQSVGTFTFERNEQGTFHHDVFQRFLEKALRHPDWPDLSEKEWTGLLEQVLKERVRQWDGSILTSDTPHRYQGAAIIRGVRTAVASQMRSFRRKPHFLPLALEVPFGTPDSAGRIRIPAIQIRLPDGDVVAFTGRIDRIDTLKVAEDKQYFMIVDYKMSSREIQQNSLEEGLQLQLPLYVQAARSGLPGYEAAGALYQPVKDVLVDREDPSLITHAIDQELRASGMILDDPVVQDAAAPVKASKKSASNDTVSSVSAGELLACEQTAYTVISDSVMRIRGGDVAPRPVQDGREPPCTWCEHADACLHDITLPGCRIREVQHKRSGD